MTALQRLDAHRYLQRATATRMMLAYETALERHLARVIAQAGKAAGQHLVSGGERQAEAALKHLAPELNRVLKPSIKQTAQEFAKQLVISPAAKSLPGFERKAFEDLDQEVNRFIDEHAATRVVQISDSLRATIAQIIRNGLDDGSSSEDIAQAIVEATSGEIAQARARRIARTETHTAANMGQYAAARASPLEYEKEWLAVEDARTRPEHAAANGQRVALDEDFVVGGENLHFPGDPNGSPGNIINCRCTVLYVPVPAQPGEQGPAGEIDAGDLLGDVQLWRAFFEDLRQNDVTSADITLYASGPDCGLPEFARADDLIDEIGQQINSPRHASLSPIMLDGGAGLADTFPPLGRPVVVKITVPAGTPARVGREIAMEIALPPDVSVVVTDVTEDRWGDVQDDADLPEGARSANRLPRRRGITLVEAEVQT